LRCGGARPAAPVTGLNVPWLLFSASPFEDWRISVCRRPQGGLGRAGPALTSLSAGAGAGLET